MNRRIAIALIPLTIGMLGAGACASADGSATAKAESAGKISLEAPSDEALERRLAAIFSQFDGLRDVQVRVGAGVVHLSGTTDNIADAQRAAKLAGRIDGVVDVTSEVHPPDQLSARTWRALRSVLRALIEILPQLSAAVLVFVPFLAISLLVGRWRHPLRRLGVSQLSGSLVRFAMRGMVLIGGLLLGLEILGITGMVGAIVGTLGILGIVAGIVFKDWVTNYFPAMMLGAHPPFAAGDLVQVGEREGRVIKITPRATLLMTLDGEEVRVPNAALFERALINYSRYPERRLRFVVPLALDADLREAEELGRRALLQLRGVKPEPPPFMRVRGLARDFIDVEFFAWVDQGLVNFRSVQSRAQRTVHEALTEAGVPRPEDLRTLVFHPKETSRAGQIDATARDAEDLDEAFIDEQVDRARARHVDEERDLLDEHS